MFKIIIKYFKSLCYKIKSENIKLSTQGAVSLSINLNSLIVNIFKFTLL
jgi:hypothetical protein